LIHYARTNTYNTYFFVFGHITLVVGLYKPVFIVCATGKNIEGPVYGRSFCPHIGTDKKSTETVVSDKKHANVRGCQSVIMCGHHVSDLCQASTNLRIRIWLGISFTYRIPDIISIGNTYFGKITRNIPEQYGKCQEGGLRDWLIS